MKGTVFAVALNHQSQRVAWAEAFEKAPYNAPPKTAVWFIKPHNAVIRAGEPIPFPQGETVLSGATVALVVGKTASKVRVEEAAAYIAGYALANEISLPEESSTVRRSRPNAGMDFARSANLSPLITWII